jgi:hypothetical protein
VTWKLAAVGGAAASASGLLLQVASGGVLGAGAPELDLVVGAVVFYMVVSFPKRLMEASSLSQSREASSLSVMAAIDFEATHSRSRTMLMLMPSDTGIRQVLERVKRAILLGETASSAVNESVGTLTSYSAAEALRKAATMSPESMEEGGEENRGIVSALQLGEESKLPLFMTVCFFTPIMLLLYAVFSRLEDPRSLMELLGVQLVVLDLSFHFTSSERRRLG